MIGRLAFDPRRPDGRWPRILRAATGGIRSLGDLHRAVKKRGPGRRHAREKLKTIWAIRELVHARLLASVDGGFITTQAGLDALAACERKTA